MKKAGSMFKPAGPKGSGMKMGKANKKGSLVSTPIAQVVGKGKK